MFSTKGCSFLTFDQIFDLKGQSQVFGELVLAHPDGVVVFVQVLPEVRDGFGLDILVGIDAFELVEDEGGFGESGEGIFFLLGGRGLFLRGRWGSRFFGLLLLLGRLLFRGFLLFGRLLCFAFLFAGAFARKFGKLFGVE